MNSKHKILSVLNESLKLRVLKLSLNTDITEAEIKEDLTKVLEEFSSKQHIKEFRVNVYNMIYDCRQLPNRVDIDVWTKYENIEEKPITFNFKMNYEL
jgi:hypothetical protein